MLQPRANSKEHTILVLVNNKDGVLARIASLFSARGYDIQSLCVGPSVDPTISRMTIGVRGESDVVEKVTKQLLKLVDVLKVTNLTSSERVEREMALLRIKPDPALRGEVLRLVESHHARLVDASASIFTVEATGEPAKLEELIDRLRPLGLQEIVRTGKVAIAIGAKSANAEDEIRRKYHRYAASFEVRLESIDEIASLSRTSPARSRGRAAHDISKGGLSFRTDRDHTVDLGSVVELRLIHPHSGATFAVAAVVRRFIDQPNFRGVGVEFVRMNDAQRRALGAFIRTDVLADDLEGEADSIEPNVGSAGTNAEATDGGDNLL